MEETYQKYKGKVNFLYLYMFEAHPEEAPFFPGLESTDIGWTHEYSITTTMEQRAERARWMKTDLVPDAEIPFIIDYINSPMGDDNAIKTAYVSGPYSGYVIDSDASILTSLNWAWYGPGGQWLGLGLDPIENLHNILDDYLADPPSWYNPAPLQPAKQLILQPAVLIVDDDAGREYEGYFKIPLGNLAKSSFVWHVDSYGSPGLDVLQRFGLVIWFTGDSSTDTLTSADQTNLAAYLDGGGKLFLSGQNIGQDIGATSFYQDYLHADYIGDVTGTDALTGSDILTAISLTISGIDGANNQSSPSEIDLLDGAVGLLDYDGPSTWAALRWEGAYKIVYFAFGFEGIGAQGGATSRYKVMENLLTWLEQ